MSDTCYYWLMTDINAICDSGMIIQQVLAEWMDEKKKGIPQDISAGAFFGGWIISHVTATRSIYGTSALLKNKSKECIRQEISI